jgi:N6-L-threonylcarbamoyladenine synthase
VSPADIEGIGVTRGPGLIGSLLVGIGAAKGMVLALKVPMCGVHHLHGHIFAIFLERKDISYPFVSLVVSGGHTSLFHVKGSLDIQVIGKTRDDAAGEAFDKVAKVLGLGYPGGVVIERLAAGADPGDLSFPKALMDSDDPGFSFSGVKTAVLREVEERFGVLRRSDIPGSYHALLTPERAAEHLEKIRLIAAAFQKAVIEVLVAKGFRAAELQKVDKLVVCGGVAANQALRESLLKEGALRGIEPVFPSMNLCTDNAAMIAARAETLLRHGVIDDLGFGAKSRW